MKAIFKETSIAYSDAVERGTLVERLTNSSSTLYAASKLAVDHLQTPQPRYAKLCLRDSSMNAEQKLGTRLIEVEVLTPHVNYALCKKHNLKVESDISRLMYGHKSFLFDGVLTKGANGLGN